MVSRQLEHWISDGGYLNLVSFLLLFAAVYLVVSIAGGIIKYLMNIAFLGWMDRLTGALFGALKGCLIIAVVVLALTTFLQPETAIVKRSIVSQHTMQISAFLIKVTPKEMKQHFSTKMKAMNDAWAHP
jgi:membrane protein required for colicin V production